MKLFHHGFHMANIWTFQIKPIREILESQCFDRHCLFPFAGWSRIKGCRSTAYIDIHPEIEYKEIIRKPHIVGDAKEILTEWAENPRRHERWDVIILDPPFTFHQAVRSYDNESLSDIVVIKNACEHLVKENGKVITLGFNSTGMGKKRGFKKEQLHIFNHGGNHSDTLMLIERKMPQPKELNF